MRVLHVGKYYPPRWGGMETVLKDIAETISPHIDLEVVVAAPAGERAVERQQRPFRLVELASVATLYSQPVVPGLAGFLRRSRAQLVHLHAPNPFALACLAGLPRSLPLVVHYHSDIVLQRSLGGLLRPLLDHSLARARAIVVGSEELVAHSPILRRWRAKCVVIPFGLDLAPLLALPGPARREPPAVPVILAVGRLRYYKGFRFLIAAMRRTPARLIIVGDGEEREPLAAQIRAFHLEDRITLAGHIPARELLRHFALADIFCLPSCERSEAFGLVMAEAMAAGLPVVSTDLPTGVRSVNVHGETGLVVKPADPGALAAALGELIRSPGLRFRYGQAGRCRASQLFRREVMGASLLRLYQGIVGGI